jgi:hypothetical protein
MERTELLTRETLENAFIVGLLLTGSMERTEIAVMESVRWSCPDDLFGEKLFRRVIHCSIETEAEFSSKRWSELNRALSILPYELRCVLALPEGLRHCFVLRILVGLPREVCSWLLHIDIPQINQRTHAAMFELADIQESGSHISQTSSSRVIPIRKANAPLAPRRFRVHSN